MSAKKFILSIISTISTISSFVFIPKCSSSGLTSSAALLFHLLLLLLLPALPIFKEWRILFSHVGLAWRQYVLMSESIKNLKYHKNAVYLNMSSKRLLQKYLNESSKRLLQKSSI